MTNTALHQSGNSHRTSQLNAPKAQSGGSEGPVTLTSTVAPLESHSKRQVEEGIGGVSKATSTTPALFGTTLKPKDASLANVAVVNARPNNSAAHRREHIVMH